MICVNPAVYTDFSTNGNGTLASLSAEATETLNGKYELTPMHPIDSVLQETYQGGTLLNDHISGGFPVLKLGMNGHQLNRKNDGGNC